MTVWSLNEKRIIARGEGHRSWVTMVAFDPHTSMGIAADGTLVEAVCLLFVVCLGFLFGGFCLGFSVRLGLFVWGCLFVCPFTTTKRQQTKVNPAFTFACLTHSTNPTPCTTY